MSQGIKARGAMFEQHNEDEEDREDEEEPEEGDGGLDDIDEDEGEDEDLEDVIGLLYPPVFEHDDSLPVYQFFFLDDEAMGLGEDEVGGSLPEIPYETGVIPDIGIPF